MSNRNISFVNAGWMYHWALPRINRVRRPRHLYQKIEKEFKSKLDWPKINDKDFNGKMKYKRHLQLILTKKAIYKIIFIQMLNKNHRK
jgi:hypothetical protein